MADCTRDVLMGQVQGHPCAQMAWVPTEPQINNVLERSRQTAWESHGGTVPRRRATRRAALGVWSAGHCAI